MVLVLVLCRVDSTRCIHVGCEIFNWKWKTAFFFLEKGKDCLTKSRGQAKAPRKREMEYLLSVIGSRLQQFLLNAVLLHTQLHDLVGGLRSVPAVLHQLLHLNLGQPHPKADRPILGLLDVHRAPTGERQIRHRAAGEPEALQPFLGAHLELPGPGPPWRSSAPELGELNEKVELPSLELRIRVKRPGPEGEALDLVGFEEGVARVVSEHGNRLSRRLHLERGTIYLHDLGSLLPPTQSIAHVLALLLACLR